MNRGTNKRFDEARERLRRLGADVLSGGVGRAEPWGGAGVIVTDDASAGPGEGWSDPVVALTPHVAEVSWVFEQARDAVSGLDGYGIWKEEFFGRMAESIVAAGPDAPLRTHLGVVLWAADRTLDQIMERASR